jgi:membrane protein YdbS with pleckstrin-like domain
MMDGFTPLDPRARALLHLQAVVRWLTFWLPSSVFFAFGASALFRPEVGVAVGATLGFLTFVASLWLPAVAFDRWGWALRPEGLAITRGVWVRADVLIPLQRIQHVDLRQGLIEQWMGLASLQVHTASGLGADGAIPGLDFEEAQKLREKLVKSTGDDGV